MKKRMHSYNLIRSFVTGQKRCMSSIDTLVLESKILWLQIENYFCIWKNILDEKTGAILEASKTTFGSIKKCLKHAQRCFEATISKTR